jgi:hypothetical protein
MPSNFAETMTRSFNPMSAPGLSDDALKAVNAAFDAMSTWRAEVADNNERNIERVIEKIAAAAGALGWPTQVVDATRTQMQTVTKMQIQTMDQVMDTWEEQIKSPNPSPMLSRLKSLSTFGQGGGWPNAGIGQLTATNPLQFYMQFAEQWQKAWAEAMTFWMKVGSQVEGTRRH